MDQNLVIKIINSNILIFLIFYPLICDTKLFIPVNNCSEHQYFDTNQMSCQVCVSPLQLFGDPFHQNKVQIRSTDGLSCICKPGFRSDFTKLTNGKLFCSNDTSDCPIGSKPINGFQCAICHSNLTQTSHNDSTDSCQCPKGHYLVQSINKINDSVIDLKCEKCPKNSMVTSDGKSCEPCHHSYIKVAKMCDCSKQTYIEEDGMCLPESDVIYGQVLIKKEFLNSISWIDLDDQNRRFISDYFYRKARPAVYNCKFESNRTACQLVANLCVLYHYSYSDESDSKYESNICRIFDKYLETDIDLYFKGSFKSELTQYNVPNRFKINDQLEFIASRFTIDGQLISYSELNSKELQLCYEDEKSSKSGFVFNTNFRQTCVRTARDLWDNYNNKNIFFDLYLKNINNNEITLYPIRVLNKNIKRNNKLVNSDVDTNTDSNEDLHSVVLTKRFFLIDSITGIEKSSDDSLLDYNRIRPKFIRIAKSIVIDVRMRKQDGSGSIFPPLITISYENIHWSDYESNTEIKIDFSITYSMDDTNTKTDLSITISVFCCLAVLWAIFRTWCWAKRNGKIALDFFTVIEFFVNTIGWLSVVFFVINLFFAINTFVVFKNQSVIHTLLPTEEQENSLIIYLIIAFLLKSIHLIYKLLVIATIDIFFIDWERPKKRDSNSMVTTMSRPKSSSTLNDTESIDRMMTDRQIKPNSGSGFSVGSPLTSPSPKLIADKPLIEFPNVTVWRTNFVANEWMELCGYRRLSLSIHILLVIIVLDWLGFANLSYSHPNNSLVKNESQRYVLQSTTCRLAVGALVYLVLAVVNIAFKKFLYENLFNDKMSQFVDLCSVCNISLFAMVYKRFGYYIHGLAANGKSDVNMMEMYELLEREENDLCSKRGLLPNSDQQTFEMCLPAAISEHYQRFRSNLSGFAKLSDRMRSVGGQIPRIETDKLIPTYLMINKFLTGFIEHNFKDVDYMVREKSTVESILDIEFVDSRDKGFFYSDNGHSFEAILFYGLEFTLLSFEIMLFLVSDLYFQSFTVAAVITFIISKSIRKLYLNITRKNLVRKALIDQRFLI